MTCKQNKGLERENNCLRNWNIKRIIRNRKPKIWKPKCIGCVVDYVYVYIYNLYAYNYTIENLNRTVYNH